MAEDVTEKKPSRGDDRYTKEMKFEEYEYTNFITYEFAMRNENVINLLNLQSQLLAIYNTFLPESFHNYKITEDTEDILDDFKELEEKIKDLVNGLLNYYNINQFSDDIACLTLKNVKEIFSNIINEIAKELYEKYYIIYQNDIEALNKIAKELYNPSLFLERDKFLTEYVSRIVDNEEYYKANYNTHYEENEYFVAYQEISKNQKDYTFSIIYPKYNRAMRDFTDTKLVLNLNLSENELVDCIKKIKKNYDSKNSIIKTKIELLEIELLEEKFATSDHNKILKRKDIEWADNFFIYDYFLYHRIKGIDKKLGDIKKEIQIDFTKFYGIRKAKKSEEIKNTKDRKHKLLSKEEYIKDIESQVEDTFYENLHDCEHAISIKTIENKYKLLKQYIEGENPMYKMLLEK